MLRVIIADDEERICKLIEILADWDGLRMEVVGVAGNGLDALRLIGDLAPDILITDIRMPGLNGLEVISEAKRLQPALEIIIVSGFAQFDYAQTAIGYGVGDYLLKPINKEALNATLKKMGDKCRARRRSQVDLERMRVSHEGNLKRLRENMAADLIAGRFAATSAAELYDLYHFSCTADTCQVFLLMLDCDGDRFAEPSLGIVHGKILDVLAPALQADCADALIMPEGTCVYGVINYPCASRAAVKNGLRDALNQLLAQRNLFGSVSFTLALGLPVDTPGRLPESFDNARELIAERLIEGVNRLLEGTLAPSALPGAATLARYSQDIARAIDVLDEGAATGAVDALKKMALSVGGVCGYELKDLALRAGSMFLMRLAAENREQALGDFACHLDRCHTVDALFDRLASFEAEQLRLVIARQKSREGQPIRAAKQFIHQHFAEPITLEQVSASVGFSANYFSALFKRETGEGFVKYLSRVRIDEAKALLRETRLSVPDVCRQVGYEDVKHFSRTFKQESGITPGEYRKLYG